MSSGICQNNNYYLSLHADLPGCSYILQLHPLAPEHFCIRIGTDENREPNTYGEVPLHNNYHALSVESSRWHVGSTYDLLVLLDDSFRFWAKEEIKIKHT